LENFLDKINPDSVLIEGASDTTHLIPSIANKNVKPPVAILAFTADFPINSVMYPFAEYSPEYRAILWAVKHNKNVRFIDLPAEITVTMGNFRNSLVEETPENSENGEKIKNPNEYYKFQRAVYEKIAELNGENSYDDYWERNFEYNLNSEIFMQGTEELSAQIRLLTENFEYDSVPEETAYNFLRESYMRRQIYEELKKCVSPHKIAVICGAYHLSALKTKEKILTDKEIADMPKRAVKSTLMPYSFFRLSSFSGYGAGNKAPQYFQLVWECIKNGKIAEISENYVATLGEFIRSDGGFSNVADEIEAVRLAKALAAMKGGFFPNLADIEDAATACIAKGERSKIAVPLAAVNIGTALGELPENLSQTSIQVDMTREIKRLKLEKYKTTVTQQITLDLRQNINRKSYEAQYLDLNRSVFFHRLVFLGIYFARKCYSSQEKANWKELWDLKWTTESEIQLVENVLRGETIKAAAALHIQELTEEITDITAAAELVKTVYNCELTNSIKSVLKKLQFLFADCRDFVSLAKVAADLADTVNYSDVRNFDTTAVADILQQVFLAACLSLRESAKCDAKAAEEIFKGMEKIERIAHSLPTYADNSLWNKTLDVIANDDTLNSAVSGAAFAILLEKSALTNDFISGEIHRRFSAGVPGDIAAAWFHGVSQRNHYVLLSRPILWQELDNYLETLDDESFKTTLIYLRRTFAEYELREKSNISDLIADIWKETHNVDLKPDTLLTDLTDDETDLLASLDDFDF
jgi:hypothetical protein